MQQGMQQAEDQSHLQILSIIYYVFGGFQILGGLMIGVYMSVIGTMFSNVPHRPPAGPDSSFFAMYEAMFVVMGILALLMGAAMGALNILVGSSLGQRRRYTLCLIMAAITCLGVPLGTLLGVFTLIVLNRPSVKALFDQNARMA
jgi:hypothetical protein